VKLTSNFQHIELTASREMIGVDISSERSTPFNTTLTWNERADLRLILKMASQSPGFNKQERDLALRVIGELDQLPLEF